MNFKYVLAVVLFFASAALQAQTEIQHLRVVAPIPGQSISAAYLVLKNNDSTPVELVSIESESADKIEIHTHEMSNGMMNMIQLDSLEVAANSQAEFVQGGLHLMVFSPDLEALESGTFGMVFHFADGSSIQTQASVEHLMPMSMPMNHQQH